MEYVASSHSYTACPNSFDEFYNQRRRWTPSTLANQWDLLHHSWVLLKYGNTNIVHMFYIVVMLMAGLLGPGSIFLMLVGGLHLVSSSIDLWTSFAINAALITTFFTVSLFCRQKAQLLVAKVLSLLYACIMIMIMFVLILDAITQRDSCWQTPSTVTLIVVVSVFFFSGLLHPSQFFNLIHGFVYYLTIPSISMILPFYCIFNLTDTTWGTRENAEGGQKANGSWIQRLLGINNNVKAIRDILLRGRDIETQTQESEFQTERQETQETQEQEPERQETQEHENMGDTWVETIEGQLNLKLKEILFGSEDRPSERRRSGRSDMWEPICSQLLPLSIEKDETGRSRREEIGQKIKKDLENLKVNALLIYLFFNITFVLGIFLMQIRFDSLNRFSQDWPLCKLSSPLDALLVQNHTTTPTPNPTFWEERLAGDLTKETTYMQLDPINMVFIVVFLGVMFFQVAGMIFHRVRNAGHLMATIRWPSSSPEAKAVTVVLHGGSSGGGGAIYQVSDLPTPTNPSDTLVTGMPEATQM